MNSQQITLVQTSFTKVMPIADKAASLFYERLFEIDPALRPMFSADITEQGAKLMKMIGMAVNSLNDLDSLVPVVQSLGKRHEGYGVEDSHYGTVGEALIWTLEQGLADDFTEEVREAWLVTYSILSTVMIEASKSA